MHRLNTALAVAAIAISAGGTSYAATKLAAGSVTSREVKNGSIRTRDLDPSARPPSRAKVAQAVTEVLSDPTTGLSITVHGEKGDKGDAGAAGPAGPAGTAAAIIREGDGPVIPNGETGSAIAYCADGERVIGGGARLVGETSTATGTLLASYPLDAQDHGWQADYRNTGGVAGHVHAWAICAAA